jgi:diadenosine tetraphosphate (Ap4A) HIT family hydrolase
MVNSEMGCIFCKLNHSETILENRLFYSRWDKFPVSYGHAEVIPKRHIESFLDLSGKEVLLMYDLIKKTKEVIDDKFSPDAYNLGINEGEAAGRTIHHLHVHLIPRYYGDVKNPRGGVRHVIPGKGDY